MDTKTFTLDNWRDFMNGYRDPVTRAADREQLRQYWKDAGEDFEDFPGGGGGGLGASGGRECGSRVEGGTYAVVPTSPNGTPVDNFLLCKPRPVNKEEYNLSNVGVRLIDIEQDCYLCGGKPTKGAETCQTCYGTGKETVTHIFDIVGQEYYPNVADFVEEARRLGISRRLELETKAEYARLSTRSRLFLLHHRAGIKNPLAIYEKMLLPELKRLQRAGCPKGLEEHNLETVGKTVAGIVKAGKNPPGCSALYWNVLEEGATIIPEFSKEEDNFTPCPDCNAEGFTRFKYPHPFAGTSIGDCKKCSGTGGVSKESRFAERKLKSGSYRGYALPFEVKPDYELAIFGIFPLGKIEVINPGGEYDDRVDRVSSARLDVEETES